MPKIFDGRDGDGLFVILGESVAIPSTVEPNPFATVTPQGTVVFDANDSVPKIYRYDGTTTAYGWEQLCSIYSLSMLNGISSFDVTGTDFRSDGPVIGSGSLHLSLSRTGIASGEYSYPNVTVDANGRITSIVSSVDPNHYVSSVAFEGDGNVYFDGSWNMALSARISTGTFTNANIAVDAQGRVSTAASGVPIDGVTTLTIASSTLDVSGGTITGNGSAHVSLKTVCSPSTVFKPNITVDAFGYIHSVAVNTPSDFISPEMFGAVGDGTVDDTVAFSNMCKWAAGNYDLVTYPSYPTTDTMRLSPNRTYYVSGGVPMVGGRLYGAPNAIITVSRDTGIPTPLSTYVVNSTPQFQVNNNDRLVIENAVFVGCLLFSGNNTVVLDNCGMANSTIDTTGVSKLYMRDCNLTAAIDKDLMRTLTPLDVAIIEDNMFAATASSTYLGRGLRIQAKTAVIRRNNISNNGANPMFVPIGFNVEQTIDQSMTITNNTFFGECQQVAAFGPSTGILEIDFSNNYAYITSGATLMGAIVSYSFNNVGDNSQKSMFTMVGNVFDFRFPTINLTAILSVSRVSSFLMAGYAAAAGAPLDITKIPQEAKV